MRILITGSSGLVGRALIPELGLDRHDVIRLVRSHAQEEDGALYWNPQAEELESASLEGVDAVIHLSGENVASGRWTTNRKKRLVDSRVQSTRLLSETLARLEYPPMVLISASAAGYYGSRGDELLTEEACPGSGFLADLCVQWENALHSAIESGIRVIALRLGVVLTSDGGALAKMLPAFKLGLGGKLGPGNQYMSWLSLDDLVRIVSFLLENEAISGPVNTASPKPVTNIEFTRTLGRVLRRSTLLGVPAFALKLLFGEMAQETLLSSGRLVPTVLTKHGFEFSHPDIETALRSVLS